MNDILNKYIEHNKTIYENKKLKQFEYSKRVLFTTKNGREYSLFDANQYKLKTKASIYENEISSILRVLYNNVAIFRTSTTNSKYNIKSSDKSVIDINKAIKNQYERLKGFHSHRWQFKNNNIRLKARNLKIYELTESLNLHSNTVDVLSSTNDLLHYIKALVLARKKYDIGRVELLVNKHTLKKIKSLFIDNYVVVRINNKEKILYLKENGDEFVICGLGDRIKGGNYIYFKAMDSKKNSKRAMLRYFYKNSLFEAYENKPTKEHIIFSKLGIRIQQFSKDFFNRGVSKKILYKTNNRLLYLIKHNKIELTPTKEDKVCFLSYTASLFRKQLLRREQNKEVVLLNAIN